MNLKQSRLAAGSKISDHLKSEQKIAIQNTYTLVKHVPENQTSPDFRQLGWVRFTEPSAFRQCPKSGCTID